MKLTSKNASDLMKCKGKDEIKYHLTTINYNNKLRRLEATNGHIMTSVIVDFEADTNFLIEVDASFKCKESELIHLQGIDYNTNIITFAVTTPKSSKKKFLTYSIDTSTEFPDIERVTPKDEELTGFEFSLNISLLPTGSYTFKLKDANSPLKAFDLDSKQKFIIMPIRV